MTEIELATLLAAGAIMVAAGLVHGTLGMGFPLVATPLLSLMLDVRTAILLTLLPTAAVNVASILRGGRWGESIGRFWPLAAYGVVGSMIGSRLLVVSDPAPFKLVMAALIVLYLGASRLGGARMGWVNDHLPPAMAFFGLAAGLAAGTTNVMVPILIVFSLELGLGRTVQVQVFNLCFLAGKLAQIVVFGLSGLLTAQVVVATTPMALAALAALAVGMTLRDRIPAETYRAIMRWVLLALALLLAAQYALGR